VVEEGMVDLMQQVVASGRVLVTTDVREAVLNTDLSLICVGTPSASNGSQDQGAMLRLAKDLGIIMRDKATPHTFVFRSTLVPGTVEEILRPIVEHESGKRDGIDFHLCFQPEFLREGSSIRDYDKPPFTIVGANSEVPVELLRQLFGSLPCQLYATSIRSAEMVKYACNNFHALKITFANEMARVCEVMGVDPFEVMDLVCKDTQLNISTVYLKPGFAFGGSCLPKDLRATMHFGKMRDVELPMLGNILTSNRAHIDHAIEKVMATGKRRIGMVGLSFKTGTDDLRESPLVAIAEYFYGKGLQLLVYDPEVHLSNLLGANRRFIEKHVPHIGSLMRSDLESVIAESDVLVLGLADPGIYEVLRRSVREDQVVIDLVRMPNCEALRGQYQGLCW
jgi:GDP-mannose 6-dehydrogenase